MKRRKAIAAVLAAVLSLVSASAAYAEELSEQEMTEVLEQEPTEQEMRRRMQSRWRGNISPS